MQKVASNGYVRNKLTVFHGGRLGGSATAFSEPETADIPMVSTGTLAVSVEAAEIIIAPNPRLEKIREARMKGYEGDSCGECGNFTLVRNGTCLKCDTCGSTSGCS
jgi:ribonucleoside-diphosphate reductase alpha chain